MPAQNNTDYCTDKVLSKSKILEELTKSVKLVYVQSLYGNVVLDGDSWLVYWLDRALRHGLRVERYGYWGTAREVSHQDTIVVIHALQNVLTSIGKGKAWLYHTLSEGSFESYLACILRDAKTLKKQYYTHALLRDGDKTNQLINLLAGLENVSFTLQLDVSHLDVCNYMPKRPMNGSPTGSALFLNTQPSSISSNLASPVDDKRINFDSELSTSNEIDLTNQKEEDWSLDNFLKYRNKYKLLSGLANMNENLEKSFLLSDYCEGNKIQKQSSTDFKLNGGVVTSSDIINQNFACEVDEYNLNHSNPKTDHSFYQKIPDHYETNDIENNDIKNYESTVDFKYYDNRAFNLNKNDLHNSYVINNDTNLLELNMTISDSENIEAPCSILNTADTFSEKSILSTSYSDPFQVQRRQRKKRGEGKKRVSFHEDIFKMMKLDDDESYSDYCMSFVPGSVPSSVQNKRPDIGRHSWCGNSDNSTTQNTQHNSNVNKKNMSSDYYSSSSTLSLVENDAEQRYEFNFENFDYSSQNAQCSCLSISERGVPEGQEDPLKSIRPKLEIELEENEAQEAYIVETFGHIVEEPEVKLDMPRPLSNNKKYASSSDWSDVDSLTSEADEKKNTRHLLSPLKKRYLTPLIPNDTSRILAPLKQATSKTSLLNRFLRSITQKKLDVKREKKIKPKNISLQLKDAKIDQNSIVEFNKALDKEIQEVKLIKSGEKINTILKEIFRQNIYRDKTEKLYKVYKVRSSYMINGESKPMLALLTDKTLYITALKHDQAYSNQFVIPYNELDVILIGPNAQTILISNADYEMQYLFSTGNSERTSELISHLEIAMRRCLSKPKLPAVKELYYGDLHVLKHSILAETVVHSEEKIEHYCLIYMEDDHISPPSTPCGPIKEGDLMFRPHTYYTPYSTNPQNPWEAGYFVLKGGVVYMFADSDQKLPKHAIPLKSDLCQGCRRIPNSHRPHTFEILLKPNKAFQFAAPDEYVASDWLQSFIQSASGLFDFSEKREPLPCSLVVTSKHLVTLKEFYPGATKRSKILSCASIEDLTAFRVPIKEQTWCILEFSCREVHENSGDWVLYFTSYRELCAFQEILQKLWAIIAQKSFPLFVIQSEDKLLQRCSNASKDLDEAWRLLLPIDIIR